MDTTQETLQRRISQLENKLGIGGQDPAKDGYLVLVKILKQQNDFLNDFSIKSKIASDDAADKITYKNAKDLWENLPQMIKSVSSLRTELKMDEVEEKQDLKPITAKEIANGNVFTD